MSSLSPSSEGRPFLGVYFRNCNAYGGLYRNRDRSAHTGFCPKCIRPVRIGIGASGTTQRQFEYECTGGRRHPISENL